MYPITHFAVPVLLLIFLFRMDKKIVFLLSPLTVFPDFDFFTTYHRLLFHNIFVGILSVFALFLFFQLFFKIGNKKKFILIGLLLFYSHLLFDFDEYGVSLFYPLDDNLYGFNYEKMKFVVNEFPDGFKIVFPFEKIPEKEVILIVFLQLIFWYHSINDFYRRKLIKSKQFNSLIKIIIKS